MTDPATPPATVQCKGCHRSVRGLPPIGARGASGQREPATDRREGCHQSARGLPPVSARAATSQSNRCQCSGRGVPPVSATPTRSRRRGRHSSARGAPAPRYRGAICRGSPDQRSVRGVHFSGQGVPLSSARGATRQREPCPFSVRVPPLWQSSYWIALERLASQGAGLAPASGTPCAGGWNPFPRIGAPNLAIWCSLSLSSAPTSTRCGARSSMGRCTRRANRVTLLMRHRAPLAFDPFILDTTRRSPTRDDEEELVPRASALLGLCVPPDRSSDPRSVSCDQAWRVVVVATSSLEEALARVRRSLTLSCGEPCITHAAAFDCRESFCLWCGRGDSNPHDIAIASPSRRYVWGEWPRMYPPGVNAADYSRRRAATVQRLPFNPAVQFRTTVIGGQEPAGGPLMRKRCPSGVTS